MQASTKYLPYSACVLKQIVAYSVMPLMAHASFRKRKAHDEELQTPHHKVAKATMQAFLKAASDEMKSCKTISWQHALGHCICTDCFALHCHSFRPHTVNGWTVSTIATSSFKRLLLRRLAPSVVSLMPDASGTTKFKTHRVSVSNTCHPKTCNESGTRTAAIMLMG